MADNVLFTATALPIVDAVHGSLSGGSDSQALYWGLVLGADLGGNLTHVGGAANMVAVGLLAQAGYRMSFGRFVRIGLPVTIAALAVTTLWLFIRIQ
jgi:Na+/H+ antiporter NhaD/arsenite permease-like protein